MSKLIAETSLCHRLIADADAPWDAYTRHDFVEQLAAGTLPEAAFRFYLEQDYLFLIHFARAYALAVYKADTLADMRAAAATVSALIDHEIKLHVEYCKGWGLSEEQMAAVPEHPSCVAYTRYVLERGMTGDQLDLLVALAPCVIGYGVIGERLASAPSTKTEGNPYSAWIEMYSGEEYLDVVRGAVAQIDAVAARRGGEARYSDLAKSFRLATELEVGFWQMGLDAA